MKPIIVVEGKKDAKALQDFLPEALHGKYELAVADGRSSAISHARTLLALSKGPVALVVDADTADPSQVKRQESTLSQLLQSAAAGTACEAFVAVPTLERAKHLEGLIRDIVRFVRENGDLAVAA